MQLKLRFFRCVQKFNNCSRVKGSFAISENTHIYHFMVWLQKSWYWTSLNFGSFQIHNSYLLQQNMYTCMYTCESRYLYIYTYSTSLFRWVRLLYTMPVVQVRLQSSHYYLIMELMYMQWMWWVTLALLLVYMALICRDILQWIACSLPLQMISIPLKREYLVSLW